ncbi:MAG: hypothetical protein MUE72_08365 [Chitinophagaceae bacterium]|nr:hypothetical protein [Chitinophagaceae bacterium]
MKDKKPNLIKDFGIEYNKTRNEIGLPLLDSLWRISYESDEMIQWMPIKSKDSLSFLLKRLIFKNAILCREENIFNGKDTYTTPDGKFIEKVYITYDFLNSKPNSQWICEYYGLKKEFGERISRKQADSILRLWGVNKW